MIVRRNHKNNRNHRVKALVKKRGDASILIEDAEDAISAVMSPSFFRDTPRQSPIFF